MLNLLHFETFHKTHLRYLLPTYPEPFKMSSSAGKRNTSAKKTSNVPSGHHQKKASEKITDQSDKEKVEETGSFITSTTMDPNNDSGKNSTITNTTANLPEKASSDSDEDIEEIGQDEGNDPSGCISTMENHDTPRKTKRDDPSGSISNNNNTPKFNKLVVDISILNENTENIKDWLLRYDLVSQSSNNNEEVRMISLPIFLSGTVLSWWYANQHNFNGWIDAKKQLIKAFSDPNEKEVYKQQLEQRKQAPNETVKQYANEIVKLCYHVNPTMKDSSKVKHFLRGLDPKIYNQIFLLKTGKTFEEVRQLAMEFERNSKVSVLVENKENKSVLLTEEKPMKQLQEQLFNIEKRFKSLESRLDNPYKSKFGPRSSSVIRNNRNFANKNQCTRCNEYGHVAIGCRKSLPNKFTRSNKESKKPNEVNLIQVPVNAIQSNSVTRTVAKVAGETTEIVLDSGSSVSIIKEEFLETLPTQEIVEKEEPNVVLRAANNEEILPTAKVEVPIEFNGNTFKQDTVVVPNFPYNMLLGTDFVTNHNVVLDFPSSQMTINELPHPISCTEPKKYYAFMTEDEILPPKTCTQLIASTNITTGNNFICEPTKFFSNKSGIFMGRSLANIQNNQVTIQIRNLTNAPFKLYQGTKIATLEECNQQSVMALDKEEVQKTNKLPEGITLDTSELTEEQRAKLKQLILKYVHIFAKDKKPGLAKHVKHHIDTENHPPIRGPTYRKSPAENEIIDIEVEKMLENNIIRPSSSPWCSPVVLVKKKDGTTRFCIDFRKLNSITKKNTYPLPRIDDTIDRLAFAKFFTTLDLITSYWQVEVNEEDKEKTAFATRKGLFEFNRMPFGLSNAPATFQAAMDSTLSDLILLCCLVYIDDIIIYSLDFETHLKDIEAVFKRLEKENLYLKGSKCSFAKKQIEYLGHVISYEGVQPDKNKIQAILDMKPPQILKKLVLS